MGWGLSIVILVGWGLLPAWLLWRQPPFVDVLPASSLQQAVWQTGFSAVVCWQLDAPALGLMGLAVFVVLLQPLFLLLTWPCLLVRKRLRQCDPLREKI